MSKVITIAQQKGGSGKTTIAANLATVFSIKHNLSTVILDTDPQGSLGKWFLMRKDKLKDKNTIEFKTASLWGAQYEAKSLKQKSDIVIIDTPPKIDDGNDGPQALRGQPGDFKADIAAHGKPDGDDITINAGQCLFGHGGDAVHAECIGKSDGISASQGSNLSIIEARCQQQPRDKKQCWHRAFPLNPTLYAITVDLRPAIM